MWTEMACNENVKSFARLRLCILLCFILVLLKPNETFVFIEFSSDLNFGYFALRCCWAKAQCVWYGLVVWLSSKRPRTGWEIEKTNFSLKACTYIHEFNSIANAIAVAVVAIAAKIASLINLWWWLSFFIYNYRLLLCVRV